MGSSTAMIGSDELPENAQPGLTHFTNRSIGVSGLGASRNELRENLVPHHGHSSSGIGDGFLSLSQNLRVRARAVLGSLSPLLPMRFGVAARPTHRPISNGHSPNFSTSFRRTSSSAQINVAARSN